MRGNEHDQQDARWMAEAVDLAVKNVTAGGGPFGALIVRDGVALATGVNAVTTTNDPTAHAEVVAIRTACQTIGDFRLTGCILVTSCEPCPLCLAAALWARVDRVIYGADRHDAARGGFDDLAFYELFATPREDWPIVITSVAVPAPAAPFTAWQAKPDRVDY
ncbi:MAG TPA: nucleoside deaminase [Solirubrobacteraceae bacterium]|jgi:tRNA(Arg) A34 adenosine deaminase TadA|nr:nucleoside deaminase [Solirubrobacteraceae bacterium]